MLENSPNSSRHPRARAEPAAQSPSPEIGDHSKTRLPSAPATPDSGTARSGQGAYSDEDLKNLEKAQAEAEKKLATAKKYAGGIQKDADRLRKGIEDAGFWRTLSGNKSGMKDELKATEVLLQAQNKHCSELESSLEKSRQLIKDAAAYKTQYQDCLKRGDREKAVECLKKARESFDNAAKLVGGASSIDKQASQSYQANLVKVTARYEGSIKTLDRTETGLRFVRTTAIAVGATAATGGLATAGWGLCAAAGTSAGAMTAVGAAGNALEAVGHVHYGNKSVGKALGDALVQTGEDAFTAAAAAVSTAGAVRAARGATQVLGTRAATLGGKALVGASAGGAQGLVQSAMGTALEYGVAAREFNSHYGNLSEAEQTRLWQEFAKARGLTAGQIVRNLLVDTVRNAGAGAVGGAAGQLRDFGGAAHAIKATAIEGSADAALGVGSELVKSRLEGRAFSAENALREVRDAALGTIVGEITTRGMSGPCWGSIRSGDLLIFKDGSRGVVFMSTEGGRVSGAVSRQMPNGEVRVENIREAISSNRGLAGVEHRVPEFTDLIDGFRQNGRMDDPLLLQQMFRSVKSDGSVYTVSSRSVDMLIDGMLKGKYGMFESALSRHCLPEVLGDLMTHHRDKISLIDQRRIVRALDEWYDKGHVLSDFSDWPDVRKNEAFREQVRRMDEELNAGIIPRAEDAMRQMKRERLELETRVGDLKAGESITVGRSYDTEVTISDRWMSRHHAEIARNHTGDFVVTDQNSSHGSYYQNQRGEWIRIQGSVELKAGTKVRLGPNVEIALGGETT